MSGSYRENQIEICFLQKSARFNFKIDNFKQLLLYTLLSQATPSFSSYTPSNEHFELNNQRKGYQDMVDGVPLDKSL